MERSSLGSYAVWCCALSVGSAVAFVAGCDGSTAPLGDADAAAVVTDGALAGDGGAASPSDASAPADAGLGPPDAGADASAPSDAGSTDPGDAGSPTDPRFEVEMTYMTANIGRNYDTRAEVEAVFDRIGDTIGSRSGPKLIGWQEIGGGDPCGGSCEIEAIRARFRTEWGWATRRPTGIRPDGGRERVNVPVTSKGANDSISARAVFASPAWAGVSATRFVTVVHYAQRNLSIVNTHFIAGAWSCRPNVERRRDYWRRAWRALRTEVAIEHDRGRNVVVTGDLNRPRTETDCNPAWDPTSLHRRARIVGGRGIDYIFAVPASGWRFAVSRRADGTRDRGAIRIGIDGHQAHWVAGRFSRR